MMTIGIMMIAEEVITLEKDIMVIIIIKVVTMVVIMEVTVTIMIDHIAIIEIDGDLKVITLNFILKYTLDDPWIILY